MPGLDEDQVRHAESIAYRVVAEKISEIRLSMGEMEERLLDAFEKPRHCQAHESMVVAVDRLEQATQAQAKRRAMLPTWLSVIVGICVAIGTITWTWVQIARAAIKP